MKLRGKNDQMKYLLVILLLVAEAAVAYDCFAQPRPAPDDEPAQLYAELQGIYENTEMTYKTYSSAVDGIASVLENSDQFPALMLLIDKDLLHITEQLIHMLVIVRDLKQRMFPNEAFFRKFYCMDEVQQWDLLINSILGDLRNKRGEL